VSFAAPIETIAALDRKARDQESTRSAVVAAMVERSLRRELAKGRAAQGGGQDEA
jgi:hypothetical protein